MNLRNTVETLNRFENAVNEAVASGRVEVVGRVLRKIDGIIAELSLPKRTVFAVGKAPSATASAPKNKGGRPRKVEAVAVAAAAPKAAPTSKAKKAKQMDLPSVDEGKETDE